MNVEEYISSGILEAYVMGELSAAEIADVENVISNHPEIRAELEKIEASIEALAFATAITPPEGIQSRIMDELEDETPIISISSGRGTSFFKYAAAASMILAFTSIILAFNYWNKWQIAEERLSNVIAQNQQYAENYNMINQRLDNLQGTVAIMNDVSFQRIVMNGTDNSPEALATVYWNVSTEEVYLSIRNLKNLSQNQQYQLWAIIDGKPVDAGVFDATQSGSLLVMKSIGTGAAAFAVTIEPKGGSATPSLETMQVIGNV